MWVKLSKGEQRQRELPSTTKVSLKHRLVTFYGLFCIAMLSPWLSNITLLSYGCTKKQTTYCIICSVHNLYELWLDSKRLRAGITDVSSKGDGHVSSIACGKQMAIVLTKKMALLGGGTGQGWTYSRTRADHSRPLASAWTRPNDACQALPRVPDSPRVI